MSERLTPRAVPYMPITVESVNCTIRSSVCALYNALVLLQASAIPCLLLLISEPFLCPLFPLITYGYLIQTTALCYGLTYNIPNNESCNDVMAKDTVRYMLTSMQKK